MTGPAPAQQAARQQPGRRQLGPTDVKRLNRSWRRRSLARICLLLDSVSQPFNVGSIIRTAAALGVEHLWLCGDTAPVEHPSARKTSLGTERYLTWERADGVTAAAAAVRAAGLRLIAIELAADAAPLHLGAAARRRVPGAGQRGPRLLGRPARGRGRGRLRAADRPGRLSQRDRGRRDRAGRGPPPGMAGRVTGYLDHPGPIAFAHRGGAAGHFPENSWRAFEHAVGLGYAYLETDVHATADEVLVAFHDKTLDRVTDAAGRIARLPHREVAAARIGGTDPVPLLEDLLGAWPDVRFNVDVKDAPAVGPLVAVLRRTGRLGPGVHHLVLGPAAGRDPAAAAAAGVHGHLPGRGGRAARRPAGRAIASKFAALSVRCAQIPVSLATDRFVARAHAAGLQVHVWTVNDAAVMAGLLDLGVDGIMTDQAEELREVLVGRGQWHPRAAG